MTPEAIARRAYWVRELAVLSGRFGDDATDMMLELTVDLEQNGLPALHDHLRLCGAIPEQYGHDSSAEKLYSKYTDAVVSEAFKVIGLRSTVIEARADTADVIARAENYSLVADAKAFRLSRTAKNQKDFKVQAMDGWRGDCQYAIVVCPIYQLPGRASQIYQQAIARNVCVLSYSHISTLVALSALVPSAGSAALLLILESIALLNPGKDALAYWAAINRALLTGLGRNANLWDVEKRESLESLAALKAASLAYLRSERLRLLGLTHQQALDELIRMAGLDSRIQQVERVEHGGLLVA